MTLRRGDRLYDEGDIDDQLYVVIDGKVKLTRTSSDGREVLVRVQGPGDMFGELAMFDPTYRTSNASAVTDARLAAIAHDDLRQVLVDRPAIALLLLRELAQRLRIITDANTNLIFTDVPGRVAKALLELSDKFGTAAEDGIAGHPRPDAGGAGAAGRRVAGDRQQGARRLRRPGLDSALSEVGAADRPRPAAPPGEVELARNSQIAGAAHPCRQFAPIGEVGELGEHGNARAAAGHSTRVNVRVHPGHDLRPRCDHRRRERP